MQNKRGGRVKLQPLTAPESEFDHAEKGDALYAMELTLSLEVLAVSVAWQQGGYIRLPLLLYVSNRIVIRHDIIFMLTRRS